MSTAEEYERQAENCLAAARGAEDNTEHTMLMRLYEQWLELAAYKRSKETSQSPKINGWRLARLRSRGAARRVP